MPVVDTPFVALELAPIIWSYVPSSIAITIGTAGATMLGLWAVWAIGYRMLYKLLGKLNRTT
jgi:hypothetical protein